MDLDINKAVGAAQDAVSAIAKDENAKKIANDAIDKVEKKVGVDLPGHGGDGVHDALVADVRLECLVVNLDSFVLHKGIFL